MRIKYATHIDKTLILAHNIRIIKRRRNSLMKRRELVKLLEMNGWYKKRNGGNHDLYTNGKDTEPIPRHSDINERLARAIIKKLGLK